MPVIVPLWFYEFGSLMYFFAALIGLLLTYFSFKLYKYTRKHSHLLLTLSFTFITIGFIVLTISTSYSYFYFEQCNPYCVITREQIFNWIILSNYLYYLTSVIGYSLFFLSYPIYGKKGKKKLLLQMLPALYLNIFLQGQPIFILYPFEPQIFQPFQIVASILVLLIVVRTFMNSRKTKSRLSLMLPIGFAAILIYHILMLSIPFSPTFFALAHLSLLVGFSTLLLMLIKVTRK